MVLMHVTARSGGGAEAVMSENAPARATGSVNPEPAAIFPPGEARTISLVLIATWASEDAIVTNTARAKEPPMTI